MLSSGAKATLGFGGLTAVVYFAQDCAGSTSDGYGLNGCEIKRFFWTAPLAVLTAISGLVALVQHLRAPSNLNSGD